MDSSHPILTEIRFSGYKCFGEEQRLELKPLTILLGRNSAGKSTAARLPVLLAASMAPGARTPLDMEARGLDFGDSVLDLVSHREPHRALDFELKFRDGGVEWTLNLSVLAATLRGKGHSPTQVIGEWRLRKRDSEFSLEWQRGADLRRPAYTCHFRHDGHPKASTHQVSPFSGLLVDDLRALYLTNTIFPEPLGALMPDERFIHRRLLRELGMLDTRVSYLGPFRARAARYYRSPPAATRDVGDEGQHAPAVLAADLDFGDGQLLAQVSGWFEKHHGLRVDMNRYASSEASGTAFSLSLRDSRRAGAAVALPDVGVGIAQVLPIVVQHFLSVAQPGEGEDSRDLLICEQPELHLHPAAHASLGDLFVETACGGRTRVLVETHSENLILRVRRRVAEGRIAPDDIALYWVSDDEEGTGSTLKRLTIERDGWVDDWPDGVFAEDAAEARALGRAARKLQRADEQKPLDGGSETP